MKILSEYIHFVHSHHETQDKCILRGILRQRPPPMTPKIHHCVSFSIKNNLHLADMNTYYT